MLSDMKAKAAVRKVSRRAKVPAVSVQSEFTVRDLNR